MNWQSDLFRRLTAMLLVLVAGGIIALYCVGGDVDLWRQSLAMTPWILALATTARLLLALVIAVTLVVILRPLMPKVVHGTIFWLGKALALFPVNLIAWSFVGWWIGQLGYPIWTLMPMTESGTDLSMLETWARWCWTWTPVVGLASVPLTGQCMSLSCENDVRSRDIGIDLLGLLALGVMLCLEDVFILSGAGTYLATAVRQSDAMNLASAVWLLTAISLVLAAILSLSESWLPGQTNRPWWLKTLLGSLLEVSAWCLTGWIMTRGITGSGAQMMSLTAAFDDPAAILQLGLPWTLGALALWGVGRLIQSR